MASPEVIRRQEPHQKAPEPKNLKPHEPLRRKNLPPLIFQSDVSPPPPSL